MAEGDGFIYNEFKEKVMEGVYNLGTGGDTVKVALFSASYTPDIDADTAYGVGSLASNECSGTGYTTGGATLGNQDATKDTTNDRGIFDGDDVTWTGLGTLSPQPAYAVMYSDTASPKSVIAYWEVVTPTNGGNWTLQFSTTPSAILLLT